MKNFKTNKLFFVYFFIFVSFVLYFVFNKKEILNYEYYIRIFISGTLGFIIGFDRIKKLKPAGFKTYSLISIGSCLITIISILAVGFFSQPGRTQMDPMRLVAQLLPAVGFVGAGTIWFADNKVKGLTSAALVFFTCVIGIGIGAGFYGITIFTFLIIMAIIKIGDTLEYKISGNQHQDDD